MTEEYKQRKRAYIIRYQKENYTTITFQLRTKDDKDILEHLRKQPNKSQYLKDLIKRDM